MTVFREAGLYEITAAYSVRGPLLGRPVAAEDFHQDWLEVVNVDSGELVDLRVADPSDGAA